MYLLFTCKAADRYHRWCRFLLLHLSQHLSITNDSLLFFYSLVDFAYCCKFYQISASTDHLISFFLILYFHFSCTWKPWTQNSGPHWFSSLLQKVLSFRADISLAGFTYLIFTCMPGGSYHKWSRSLVLHFLECVWYLSSTINSLC